MKTLLYTLMMAVLLGLTGCILAPWGWGDGGRGGGHGGGHGGGGERHEMHR